MIIEKLLKLIKNLMTLIGDSHTRDLVSGESSYLISLKGTDYQTLITIQIMVLEGNKYYTEVL